MYARDVRRALSYLIPRQYIITNLLQGAGVAGITEMPVTFASLYPAGMTADPYSPAEAATYLSMAGYGTYTPPPPSAPVSPPAVTPITAGNITATAPGFLLGSSITFTGTFAVNPIVGATSQGFAVVLEQAEINNKTSTLYWPALDPNTGQLINGTALLWTTTSTGGYYQFTYTPTSTGTYYYRVWFTGLAVTTVNTNAVTSPLGLFDLSTPGAGNQQVVPSQTSLVAKYTVGSLSGSLSGLATSISNALAALATSTTTGLNTVQTSLATEISTSVTPLITDYNTLTANLATANSNIATLTTNINNLKSQVDTLSYIAYAAIALAIILGLVAIFMARRKPST